MISLVLIVRRESLYLIKASRAQPVRWAHTSRLQHKHHVLNARLPIVVAYQSRLAIKMQLHAYVQLVTVAALVQHRLHVLFVVLGSGLQLAQASVRTVVLESLLLQSAPLL